MDFLNHKEKDYVQVFFKKLTFNNGFLIQIIRKLYVAGVGKICKKKQIPHDTHALR